MQFFPRKRSVQAVSALADPLRARIYEFLSRSAEPASRDAVAQALELPRNTVSFQLERLVKEGLLSYEFRKLRENTGPGSGRPAKLYSPVAREIEASVPHREYTLAAQIMAKAIERATLEQRPVNELLAEVSRETGRGIAASKDSLQQTLANGGYLPQTDTAGSIHLTDCPFHQLSAQHRDTVCLMNRELLAALLESGDAPYRACPVTPETGHCCVRLDPLT
ncbi:transcriptional regulator [Arthrobacter sp. MYb224]|uniref:helix-turn-helix transcriptional regulator n=1 Tax=Micrococcaceae TaxID=1268 RepID=UPI000CFE0C8F|nr:MULTISPECIES: helix-turn-helix domain-containing protein [unclassified Arthrobacter]PQZ99661.1 transcriptional regulator [Arthrobacter sp. MYb224]PRA05872.1 transcriptional regulator [Arthrobacter sp. MYb229]PRB52773.1 transcriptional regulator [Arthrobacter sp. MYb216]